MKKILKVLCIVMVVFLFIACSKDEVSSDALNINGKWECLKLGRSNGNGFIEYTQYQGACDSKKDFLFFNDDAFSEISFGRDCESYTGEYTYEKRNNTLIVFKNKIQANYYYEILGLTKKELSLKQIYTSFDNQVYLVYKKTN